MMMGWFILGAFKGQSGYMKILALMGGWQVNKGQNTIETVHLAHLCQVGII